MSVFEQTKETVMLLITVIVLIFMTVFFYMVFGNYKVGSEINVNDKEANLAALRVLKCLDNNEKLDDCIKTDKYGIKVQYSNRAVYVNQKLYEELENTEGAYLASYRLIDKPVIGVAFRK